LADLGHDTMKADEIFRKGLSLLRKENTLAALACFEKSYEIEKTTKVQSYLGLCISIERGQIREAIRLCEDAVAEEPDNPTHYLNLGRVYMNAGRKADALETLRSGTDKGLSSAENAEIRLLLDKLGSRKKSVFPFLPRSHFLNKYIGLLLHHLGFR
jgi:tetratricopeptide (TPR) repeat protein